MSTPPQVTDVAEARRYIVEKNIQAILEDLCMVLVSTKPDDPIEALITHLERMESHRTGPK